VIEPNTPYWSSPLGDLLADLNTSDAGLSSEEATRRLAQVGPNTLKTKKKTGSLGLLLGQFKSPIILILIAAAFLSLFLRDPADAVLQTETPDNSRQAHGARLWLETTSSPASEKPVQRGRTPDLPSSQRVFWELI
jgi:hypothetical protein